MPLFFRYPSHNEMLFFFKNSDQFAVHCEELREGCAYHYFVAFDDITGSLSEVHVEYVRGKFLFFPSYICYSCYLSFI